MLREFLFCEVALFSACDECAPLEISTVTSQGEPFLEFDGEVYTNDDPSAVFLSFKVLLGTMYAFTK